MIVDPLPSCSGAPVRFQVLERLFVAKDGGVVSYELVEDGVAVTELSKLFRTAS